MKNFIRIETDKGTINLSCNNILYYTKGEVYINRQLLPCTLIVMSGNVLIEAYLPINDFENKLKITES
jgi:hypothetical protein